MFASWIEEIHYFILNNIFCYELERHWNSFPYFFYQNDIVYNRNAFNVDEFYECMDIWKVLNWDFSIPLSLTPCNIERLANAGRKRIWGIFTTSRRVASLEGSEPDGWDQLASTLYTTPPVFQLYCFQTHNHLLTLSRIYNFSQTMKKRNVRDDRRCPFRGREVKLTTGPFF